MDLLFNCMNIFVFGNSGPKRSSRPPRYATFARSFDTNPMVLYGFRPSMAAGNLYMSHLSGFTQKTLIGTFKHFDFKSVAGSRREVFFDLFCLASKKELSEKELIALAKSHFP